MKLLGIVFIGLLSIAPRVVAQTIDSNYASLQTVIVSASKWAEKRTEAPIAISILSPNQVAQSKASRIDFLLNKVSGVYMPSIGGEQHMMSIRQPISLKGLYLYLEDGLPIRTSGLFSSNALIEINQSNIHSIEVIKGPASALYGAEAIGGVVHFLSAPLPLHRELSTSIQMNSTGLKKLDLHFATSAQKGGWQINASTIDQRNGVLAFTDYQKNALSIQKNFQYSKKWTGFQTLNWIHYYAQMTGSVDSLHFVNKDFRSQQTFTYRKIDLIRWRQNYTYQRNDHSKTILNLLFRSNTMDQNPTYAIASTSNPLKFKGQINSNHFDAYVVDVQQQWNLIALQTKIIAGASIDKTEQGLTADYIDIIKDTARNQFTSFSKKAPDSLLTKYKTNITNSAIYLNTITGIGKHIKLNTAIRFDQFIYNFNNQLPTGTPSSYNHFNNWTPKIGLTYNQKNRGAYLNYSQGFVPPQITEMYNAIRVPFLLPQQFSNYEVGTWFQIASMTGELSLYHLKGENEIISVRQSDGVNLNQNTGSTLHQGIEYQFKIPLHHTWLLIANGTYANHRYDKTIIKGTDVSGKTMSAAPRNVSNISLQWSPSKSIHIASEWIHQSEYYMDEINTTKYPGFDLFNLRCNYTISKHEFWLHILNAGNSYYSTMATKNFSVKGNAAYSYYIGEPRSIALGWKWSIN